MGIFFCILQTFTITRISIYIYIYIYICYLLGVGVFDFADEPDLNEDDILCDSQDLDDEPQDLDEM